MQTVESAIDHIRQTVPVGQPTKIPLREARGLALAEDLKTPHDSPPFDKSMMDGFALCVGEKTEGTHEFKVREVITAGVVPTETVTSTNAARIMTGALLPAGANCVVPIERVEFDEARPDRVVISLDDLKPEQHVLRKGFNAETGDPLMAAGTTLAAQHIAVLAEFGVANVPVAARPSVAVLATGDELLDVSAALQPGRIRNSNELMLTAQIARTGASPVPLGIARDDRIELQQKIRAGLKEDILLLSGGVSAGTLDLVPSVLQEEGVEEVFHKIQMKPGKPLWFGVLPGEKPCFVFGLPGNPVSSMVCFELFVRTALNRLAGKLPEEPQPISGELTQPMSVRGDRVTFFPARTEFIDGQVQVTPVHWTGSADLRATAEANSMCRLEPGPAHQTGDLVPVYLW